MTSNRTSTPILTTRPADSDSDATGTPVSVRRRRINRTAPIDRSRPRRRHQIPRQTPRRTADLRCRHSARRPRTTDRLNHSRPRARVPAVCRWEDHNARRVKRRLLTLSVDTLRGSCIDANQRAKREAHRNTNAQPKPPKHSAPSVTTVHNRSFHGDNPNSRNTKPAARKSERSARTPQDVRD